MAYLSLAHVFIHSFIHSVPPDIDDLDSSVDMAVQEGEDAALTCRATGNPTPRVTWYVEHALPLSLSLSLTLLTMWQHKILLYFEYYYSGKKRMATIFTFESKAIVI